MKCEHCADDRRPDVTWRNLFKAALCEDCYERACGLRRWNAFCVAFNRELLRQ